MNDNIYHMIELGEYLKNTEDRASDLWTHLPSYKVAQKFHGEYASEFRPSPEHIMAEACEFIYALSLHGEDVHTELTDRMAGSFISDNNGMCLCGDFHTTEDKE